MEVVDDKKVGCIPFKDVLIGEVFKYNENYYMKVWYADVDDNAVILSENKLSENDDNPENTPLLPLIKTFDENDYVERVRAELHVSKRYYNE